MFARTLLGWSVALALGAVPLAQAQVADPVDQAYPGTLTLKVDVTDAPKRIYRVAQTIPVKPGPLTLYYPKWIPGEHIPSGPINNVSGLVITANGKQLPWRRDLRDMFSLNLDVPEGTSSLQLDFQFLAPGEEGGGLYGATGSATPKLVDIEFNQVLFYPAGYYASRIEVQPTVTLPRDWKFASALEVSGQSGAQVAFKPVSLEKLVDSPLVAGEYFKRVQLSTDAKGPVYLDIVADDPGNLKLSDKQEAQHKALAVQAVKLFGARHYAHYDFLLTLSDHNGSFGLEHQQSSDDRLPPAFLTDDNMYLSAAFVLPHEFVHSWNGKFRRPHDLWTPNYNVPMQGDLLWVYEGLTNYYGEVLTARSGMWTAEQYRDWIAETQAAMVNRTGREWRSLQDTADAVQLTSSQGSRWANRMRGVDYYPEGTLLWLEADSRIRELSGGKRSLDDFVRAFHGVQDGSQVPLTYTFDDVVATLNKVQPYDWAKFLHERLDYTGDKLPEQGVEQAGWKLEYNDQPSSMQKAMESVRHSVNLLYGMGLALNREGKVTDVQWGGPAFKAGLVPGLKLVAVNGRDYSADGLKDAIKAAKDKGTPIQLLVKNNEFFQTVSIDYRDGLRYPHLTRASGADRLGQIAAPLK
ncbi:putative metalloprotease with PDZ domain [Dyella sp. SG562]|uniref:M61 family metallopeptidase n=1 Tax=Dyella sp. SG562 TaxID=2587017 RepID=UPI001423F69E|nr:M61 family metallopeptidase [Dyella sp. SG562]NII73393.1 putative metalloprotease with PDZ domain [Dyella sp. SG562]